MIALPRRVWETEADAWALELTRILRTPQGQQTLRPVQAQVLYEASVLNGALCPVRVGGGKTLTSLLLPQATSARRPLLLIPAKLKEKTMRDYRVLANHWKIPNFIRIESYELLGRPQAAAMLEEYQPDLIVADEAHKLRNHSAAVTKRVRRYLETHRQCKFVALSGTITKRSLKDYGHLLAWTHTELSKPVPNSYQEMEDWSDALDQKQGDNPCDIGALALMVRPTMIATQGECRNAYRDRLCQTPGVISTKEGFVGSSLQIGARRYDGAALDPAFEKLFCEWQTPDGWEISDALTLWRHAREIAIGIYYRWNPRPPDEWLLPRQAWARACRHILGGNRRNLDSAKQVVDSLHHYPSDRKLYEAWKAVEDTFVPRTEAVWIDDCALNECRKWGAERDSGIIWTEHTAFAERLSHVAGWPYYGAQGKDAKTGLPIENHPGSGIVIASRASNGEGRNLQQWSENLIVSCPPNGEQLEQVVARTHRDGQMKDEVTFDILLTSIGQAEAWYKARLDAAYIEETTGQAQKILYADVTFPTEEELALERGPRW